MCIRDSYKPFADPPTQREAPECISPPLLLPEGNSQEMPVPRHNNTVLPRANADPDAFHWEDSRSL